MSQGSEPDGPRRPQLRASATQTYARKLTVAVLSLVNVIVVSKVLGPTGRGHVVFVTTLATIGSQIASLSVQEANINFAGRNPRLRPALASTSLVLCGLLSALAVTGLVVLVVVFPSLEGGSGTHALAPALVSIPLLVVATYFERLMDSDYRFTAENLASILTPMLILAVNGVLALVGELTAARAVVAWTVGIGVGSLFRLWYVSRRLTGFGRPDPELARRMLGFGLRAHGARVLGWGNYRIDQLLVGTIAGAHELGLYSYAVTWAETLFYLPQTLVAVQRPDLVRAKRTTEAARIAARGYRAAVVISAPIAVVLALLAPFLATTLIGKEFGGSIVDLRVLVLGTPGILAVQLLGNVLTAQRRPLLETAATAAAFAATLALDLLLIPPYGGLGAAIASSVAYTVGGIAAGVFFIRILGGRAADLVPRVDEVRLLWRQLLPPWRRAPLTGGDSAGPIT